MVLYVSTFESFVSWNLGRGNKQILQDNLHVCGLFKSWNDVFVRCERLSPYRSLRVYFLWDHRMQGKHLDNRGTSFVVSPMTFYDNKRGPYRPTCSARWAWNAAERNMWKRDDMIFFVIYVNSIAAVSTFHLVSIKRETRSKHALQNLRSRMNQKLECMQRTSTELL